MNEYALVRMYMIGGRMSWGLEIATNTLQDEVIIAVLVYTTIFAESLDC